MLKKPAQFGNEKSSPRNSTPLVVRNIATGEPKAKKLCGVKSNLENRRAG